MDASRQLKAEFDLRVQKPHADVVCHGGKRLVEHMIVRGLPQLGKSPHASVGNGHIYVAPVVACDLLKDKEIEVRRLVRGGIETETYRCCQLVEHVLRACFADWADLVWLTARVPGLTDDKVEIVEATLDHFCREHGCPFVAKSIIGCDILRLSANVQLEAVAVTALKDSVGESETCSMLSQPPSLIQSRSPSLSIVAPWKSPEGTTSSPMPSPPPGLLAPAGSPPSIVGFCPVESTRSSPLVGPRPPPEQTNSGPAAFSSLDLVPRDVKEAKRLENASKENSPECASSIETLSPDQPPVSSEVSSTNTSPPHLSGCAEDLVVTDEPLQPRELLPAVLASVSPNPRDIVPAVLSSKNSKKQRGKVGAKAKTSSDPPVLGIGAASKAPTGAAIEVSAQQGRLAEANEKRIVNSFAGNLSCFRIDDVSSNKEVNIMADFQLDNTNTCRVQMGDDQNYRTVRLGPSELLCSRQIETSWAQKARGLWPVTWRYEFDVALVRTKYCYVNIGLVEWISPIAEPAKNALQTQNVDERLSLAELIGLRPGEERKTEPEWQHSAENPRQRMLGCKKGVKWYVEHQSQTDHRDMRSWTEPLFQDDMLKDSILRFQCDHVFDENGYVKEVKLWLINSRVNFKWHKPIGTPVPIDMSKPLYEFNPRKDRPYGDGIQSVWVPAVTFFSQDDAVLFSWLGHSHNLLS